jgi:hypothetical protein
LGTFFRKIKETQATFYEPGESNGIPIAARRFMVGRIFKG